MGKYSEYSSSMHPHRSFVSPEMKPEGNERPGITKVAQQLVAAKQEQMCRVSNG